jgi:hypothetical protein
VVGGEVEHRGAPAGAHRRDRRGQGVAAGGVGGLGEHQGGAARRQPAAQARRGGLVQAALGDHQRAAVGEAGADAGKRRPGRPAAGELDGERRLGAGHDAHRVAVFGQRPAVGGQRQQELVAAGGGGHGQLDLAERRGPVAGQPAGLDRRGGLAQARLDPDPVQLGAVVGDVQRRPQPVPGRPGQGRDRQHRQHRLAGAGQLRDRGGLGAAFQVQQAVELVRHVGQLGDAPAAEVVVAAEDLRLETVGEALVALGAAGELGQVPRPGGGGQLGRVRPALVPERRRRGGGHLRQAPVAELGDQQRPPGAGPACRPLVELLQVPGVQAAVPVGGQQRRG